MRLNGVMLVPIAVVASATWSETEAAEESGAEKCGALGPIAILVVGPQDAASTSGQTDGGCGIQVKAVRRPQTVQADLVGQCEIQVVQTRSKAKAGRFGLAVRTYQNGDCEGVTTSVEIILPPEDLGGSALDSYSYNYRSGTVYGMDPFNIYMFQNVVGLFWGYDGSTVAYGGHGRDFALDDWWYRRPVQLCT